MLLGSRRSSLASIPTRLVCGRTRPGRCRRPAAPPSARRRRSALTARRLIEAAGPACVAVKPQLACFERLGAPGWAAYARRSPWPATPACSSSPTASAATSPVTAAAYGQALVGATPTPFGEVEGLGADAFTATRCSAATRSSRCSTRPGRPAPGVRARAHLEPRRGRRPGPAGRRTRPLWERLARLVDDLGGPGARAWPTSAPSPAPRRPSTSRACASSCRRAVPAAGHRRPGRSRGGSRAGVRAGAGRRPGHRVAQHRRGEATHRPQPAAAARAEAERLRDAAWEMACKMA